MRILTVEEGNKVTGSGAGELLAAAVIAVVSFAYNVGKDLAEQDNKNSATCKK